MPVPTGATQARGAWSDTLPVGQDVIGQGFPSYSSGAFVQETQSVGPEKNDFLKGIDELIRDPFGGSAKVLGNIFTDPLGSIGKGSSEILAIPGNAISAAAAAWWKDWGGKIVLGVLGLVLVIVGLMALSRGSTTAVIQGVKEGYANAKAGA